MADAQEIAIIRMHAKNAHGHFMTVLTRIKSYKPYEITAHNLTSLIEAKAYAAVWNEALNLDEIGDSKFDDAKVFERILDARKTEHDSLMRRKSLQPGVHAVESHYAQEATRKFLSDTAFIDRD